MQYTTKQQQFIDAALAGENLFLTGKAGTGKSYIVRELITTLQQAGRKVVAVAPTGIAANNIEGQTIHSMFALDPYGILDYDTCKFVREAMRIVLRKVDTFIIDEVSMLRPDVLDAMHLTLKKNGLPGLDKRQLIFVGDLKQLPPILSDNDRSVLYQTYDGDKFYYAHIYKRMKITTIELDEILRQTNEQFIEALNVVREGGKHPYFKQFVSKEAKGVILAPYNNTVKTYNELGLAAQAGETFEFIAQLTGKAKATDFKFEERILVKNGCKIMYLVNSSGENPLRNGTLGIFVSHNGCHYIRVGNVDYALSKTEITKKEYVYDSTSDSLVLKTIGSMEQYPIKLAYAITIHKSQGLTFDECTVDLRTPCFQKEQLYVALSRVRQPEGLRIII